MKFPKERLFFRTILTTSNFFYVFAKHLDNRFPNGWIYDVEDYDEVICSVDSTLGWKNAFFNTCDELCVHEAYEYWDSLSWENSDILDGKIADMLCAVVYDENNQRVKYEETI